MHFFRLSLIIAKSSDKRGFEVLSVVSNPRAYFSLQYKPYRVYTNYTIVLVGVTANRLETSIAVCVVAIYVSKLLALDLSSEFHASDNIIRLARVFRVLHLCRVELESYYDNAIILVSPTPLVSIRTPHLPNLPNNCQPPVDKLFYPVNRPQLLWS